MYIITPSSDITMDTCVHNEIVLKKLVHVHVKFIHELISL